MLDFAYKLLGRGLRGAGRGYLVPLGWHNEAGHRRAKGLGHGAATRGAGIWVPSLARSLEERHNRVSAHTSAGSSHNKGEQTIHKKGGLVSYPAPGSAGCSWQQGSPRGRLWTGSFQTLGACTQLCWDLPGLGCLPQPGREQ